MPTTETAPPPPARRRLLRRVVLLVVIPVLALVTGIAIYLHGGRYVETENAYLKATKTPLSSEVSAPVTAVLVRENETVKAGQVLLRLDDATFRVEVARAQARLDAVAAELAALQASYREIQARIVLARTDYDYALRERQRQLDLVQKHFVSESKLDEVRHAADAARQGIATLEQELGRVAASLAGEPGRPVTQHPSYLAAQAELQRAQIDLAHTVIQAPMAGLVTKVPDPGEYLTAGAIALVLVAESNLWVEANFNEGDLTYVRTGQPAKVRIDTFPGVEWAGEVESLSPASGAEFAILPPQNATGNWVKIVQRVPVRIRLTEIREYLPLRAGLSAWVKIDTGHQRELPRKHR